MRRVFLSYSHDSDDHSALVRRLVDQIKSDGVQITMDCDQQPAGPPEGWSVWCEAQVKNSELVLIVCTQNYRRRYDSEEAPGRGLGAVFEARIIRRLLYDSGGYNEKFRVVLFSESDNEHIPTQLKDYQRFLLYEQEGYSHLLQWLKGLQIPPPEIHWPQPATGYPWPLADRNDEFAFFQTMISGKSKERILMLQGLSNTGKTVCLAELFAYSRQLGAAAALLDFKGCPTLDDLFEALRVDLGPEILCRAHNLTGTARFYQVISDLQNFYWPVLLVFDTYEQASSDAQRWLENQLLPRLDRTPGVLIVIGGQRIPDPARYLWRPLAKVFELSSIGVVDHWINYIEAKWQCPVNRERVDTLTRATNGNPGQLSALLESLIRNLQANPND
ncbi:MAG TPA: SEFIR domain-containing protein [Pyrinomonadaceae bacterium]